MKITVSTDEARKGFYPTPPDLAAELLSDILWSKNRTILEPSCGKGNLLAAIGKELAEYKRELPRIRIDLIEIDPALRGIVSDTFIEKDEDDYYDVYKSLLYRDQADQTEAEKEKMEEAYAMYRMCKCNLRFVHDDFFQYHTMENYDLIVMNPPFADGDAHLLKAISMQERFGGKIRCILNAETLRNPYTNRRQILLRKLTELGAEVSFRDDAFMDAERSTAVSVAIIKLDIPAPQMESEFFDRFRKAEQLHQSEKNSAEVAVTDKMQETLARYRVEVNAGVRLIQEYAAMKPYIQESIEPSEYDHPILELTVGSSKYYNLTQDINAYVRAVRLKYWKCLFANKKFFGKFTSNLQDSLMSRIKEMEDVEFDEYNIRILLAEMNAQMCDGIKETILDLFHTMTTGHHYRDDPDVQNIHYYNGWATNKAHYINNKKVILPCYGVFSDYSWSKDTFKVYEAYNRLADIERTLNYLDGNMSAEVDLWNTLEQANACGKTRKIQCKFFDVTFYKKGTMHIYWTNLELLDRFNIYCGKDKNWLPPSYGKKKYEDMSADEQAVIDSFHGDDTPGSGATQYEKILEKASYYLAPATQQGLLALPETQR